MMYRFASIFLCLCLSFQTLTPFSDSSEIGALAHLLEHFQEHQEHDHISFISFLLLHYSPFSEHSSSDEHRSLPLHSPLTSVHHAVNIFLPFGNDFTINTLAESNRSLVPLTLCSHTFLLYVSIFQPPKFA
jgi:hypothetical protein